MSFKGEGGNRKTNTNLPSDLGAEQTLPSAQHPDPTPARAPRNRPGSCTATCCTRPHTPFRGHLRAVEHPPLRRARWKAEVCVLAQEPVEARPALASPQVALGAQVDGSVGLAIGAAVLPGPLHGQRRLPRSRSVGVRRSVSLPRPASAPPRGAHVALSQGPSCATAPGAPAPPRPRGDAPPSRGKASGGHRPHRPLGGPALPGPPQAGWPWAGALGGPTGRQGCLDLSPVRPGRCRRVERDALASPGAAGCLPASRGSGPCRQFGLARLVGWL